MAEMIVGHGADKRADPEREEVGEVELDLPQVVQVAIANALAQPDAHVEDGTRDVRRTDGERREERRDGVLNAHRHRHGAAARHTQVCISRSWRKVPADRHRRAEHQHTRALHVRASECTAKPTIRTIF